MDLPRLFAHARWADRAVGRALAAPGVAEAIPAAVALFAHVVTAERLYLARIRGEDPWPQDFWPELAPAAALAEAERTAEAYAALLSGLDAAGLARAARYRTSRGVEHATPIGDLLSHVVLHGAHHRGQIAALLREAGVEPPVVDFIAFARVDTEPG